MKLNYYNSTVYGIKRKYYVENPYYFRPIGLYQKFDYNTNWQIFGEWFVIDEVSEIEGIEFKLKNEINLY